MARESLSDMYLRKAREAAIKERDATDPQARENWSNIVTEYLELAQRARQRQESSQHARIKGHPKDEH